MNYNTLDRAIEQFRDAMMSAGITPPAEIYADGKKHRFSTNGKPRNTAGEYRIYTEGIPSGYFKDYRTGIYQSWCLDMGRPYTPEENLELKEIIKKREQQEQAEEEAAAFEAQTIYSAATVANENDPYLVSKGVKPVDGLRTNERGLIVPVMLNKTITSLQFIKPGRSKLFQPNGRVRGCYFTIVGKSKDIICICEGLATGISIYEATQYTVVVAFSCYNLPPVSQHIRSKCPGSLIRICGDNDESGLKFAKQASDLINAQLVIPVFAENRPEKAKDFNDMATLYGLEAVKNLITSIIEKETNRLTNTVIKKQRPLPNPLPPVMPFNPNMLPIPLRGFVMDLAKRSQCPPDFIAVSAICGLASLLGRQLLIRPKQHDNWTVTPNLWGAIIGRPSSMKSTGMKAALQLLHIFEEEFSKQYIDEKQKYDAEVMLNDLEKELYKKKARTHLKGDRRNEAIEELQKNNPTKTPTPKRLLVHDSTVEKIGELFNQNPNGLLLVRDELSGWIGKMEKEEYQVDRAFYIECYDGDGKYTYDRIGRGTIRINNCTLSIIGGIQPSKIAKLIRGAKSGISDDGLIQRFQLAVWPDEHNTWKWIDQKPNIEAFEQYSELFRIFKNLKEENNLPEFLNFTLEGQNLFIEWMEEIQKIARSTDIHPALASHLLKMPKTIASLALIFELSNGGRQAIGIEAIAMALEWADYLKSHAERLYSLGKNSSIEGAHIILKRKNQLNPVFTARDIERKDWTNLDSIDLVKDALDCLVEHGHLAATKKQTTDAGGRPTTEYSWIEYQEEL